MSSAKATAQHVISAKSDRRCCTHRSSLGVDVYTTWNSAKVLEEQDEVLIRGRKNVGRSAGETRPASKRDLPASSRRSCQLCAPSPFGAKPIYEPGRVSHDRMNAAEHPRNENEHDRQGICIRADKDK